MAEARFRSRAAWHGIRWARYGERSYGLRLQRARPALAGQAAIIVIGLTTSTPAPAASPIGETRVMAHGNARGRRRPLLNAMVNTQPERHGRRSTMAVAWASASFASTPGWSSSPTARPSRPRSSSAS